MNLVMMLFEALTLALALSLDSFMASFAYGSNKIKIPFSSIQIVNLICSITLGISFFAGNILGKYIPTKITSIICFTVLFILGLEKLLDGVAKSLICKYNNINKQIHFSMFHFKFILSLYADPEQADVDGSKTISSTEAVSLALAMSLDGLAVGFGAALGNVNGILVVLCSLIVGTFALMLGCRLGNNLAKKLPFNISWLSGVYLIVLAFLKIF